MRSVVVVYNICCSLKFILNFLFAFIENNMEYSLALEGGKFIENKAAGIKSELTGKSCCA